MRKPKVFVVGAGGMVGANAAIAVATRELVHEVVLIDIAADLVRGQAMDISHATAFTSGVHVRVGDYDEISEDDIVVVTCGVPRKPEQSRLELLSINARIIQDVVARIMAQGRPVFIVMVSNPVDVLTQIALEASGLPKNRVFGTGTTLDTARLRVKLAELLDVSQTDIQAYILGEHGDSSFPALSSATVGGIPLVDFPGYQPVMTKTIEEDIRHAAHQIIEAKKATYFGIGQVVAQIVEALLSPRGGIFPVCSLAEGEYGLDGIAIGLPSLVNASGAKILDAYPLSPAERQRLDASAAVIRSTLDTRRPESKSGK